MATPTAPDGDPALSHSISLDDPIGTYHLIPKGHGGTFSFPTSRSVSVTDPVDQNSDAYIGTLGTYTSVGIYFAVSKHRCFAAHLDAHIRQGHQGVLFDQRIRDDRMQEQLSDSVHAALEQECQKSGWRSESSLYFSQNSLITCERMRDVETHSMHRAAAGGNGILTMVGDFLPSVVVAEAVFAWLKTEMMRRAMAKSDEQTRERAVACVDAAKLEVQRRAGFVVQHGGDGRSMLSEVLRASGDTRLLWEDGGGVGHWTWVWNVSGQTPTWERA